MQRLACHTHTLEQQQQPPRLRSVARHSGAQPSKVRRSAQEPGSGAWLVLQRCTGTAGGVPTRHEHRRPLGARQLRHLAQLLLAEVLLQQA